MMMNLGMMLTEAHNWATTAITRKMRESGKDIDDVISFEVWMKLSHSEHMITRMLQLLREQDEKPWSLTGMERNVHNAILKKYRLRQSRQSMGGVGQL